MKLTFLGTRGYIDGKTKRHQRHSSLLVTYLHTSVMVDCGEDWTGKLDEIDPHAIVVTHAHPDHAWALENGAPCPVYATADSWNVMANYPVDERKPVVVRQPFDVAAMTFEAFTVEHSTRAPAVGYRITAGNATVFYVPDVVYIHDRDEALQGSKVYIGDGSTVEQSFVRKQGDTLIGHTPIRTQLTWCKKEGVPRAIITHCGPDIVEGDEEKQLAKIHEFARERGVQVRVAHDGMELVLR